MLETLLQTKLFVPPLRPNLVHRPHLVERLNQGLQHGHKLTLVCAPAGFGKTTLVTDWLSQLAFHKQIIVAHNMTVDNYQSAWLSLDKSDNDPTRFLAYFVAALQTVEADIGETALSLLQSPQAVRIEPVLTTLINEIAQIQHPFVLVLDDYHVVTSHSTHKALTFLLDHLPPNLHLIIITRTDPPLPLTRLRGRNQMAEIRIAELSFSSDEATDFLNRAMGLELSAGDIAALQDRTEGWIVGLQLVALSMQGHEQSGDIRDFIRDFTGSNRYVIDYLADEVLEQRPINTRKFLLWTSILDRLTAPLCNAVAGLEDSQMILESLEAANLFIVPLDSRRRWYRYHHLFADLLRQRLGREDPNIVPTLHSRASIWHEQNNSVGLAVDHALAAQDFERAANLIDELVEVVWGRGEQTTLLRWMGILPDEVVYSRPRLCIFHAWVLFVNGQYQAAELRLQDAEHALDSTPTRKRKIPSGDNASPDFQDVSLKGKMAAIQAFISFFRGDLSGINRFSRQALEKLPDESLLWRSMATITLGTAFRLSGNAVAAGLTFDEAVTFGQAAGSEYLTLIARLNRVVIQKEQGHLHRAAELCQQALLIASKQGMMELEIAGWIYAELGDVECEWNNLDEAMRLSKKGVELTERGNDIGALGRSCVVLVRALHAQGDVEGALGVVQKVEQLAQETDVPPWVIHPIAAWKTRLLIAGGDLDAAARWTLERGLDVANEISYLCEIEYLSLARLLVAQGNADEGVALLNRLLQAAEAGGRMGSLIDILVLQALAFQLSGKDDQAVTSLERTLVLAEPEGFVRTFVEEGPPMKELLAKIKAEGRSQREYASKLLAELSSKVAKHPTRSSPQPMVDPLTERELEVLQLIADGLTNQEIADELVVALGTVKAHTASIYGKLEVHGRTQAVARARGFGLL
jgi:LuxR family maltose regulon positive regulatory protein